MNLGTQEKACLSRNVFIQSMLIIFPMLEDLQCKAEERRLGSKSAASRQLTLESRNQLFRKIICKNLDKLTVRAHTKSDNSQTSPTAIRAQRVTTHRHHQQHQSSQRATMMYTSDLLQGILYIQSNWVLPDFHSLLFSSTVPWTNIYCSEPLNDQKWCTWDVFSLVLSLLANSFLSFLHLQKSSPKKEERTAHNQCPPQTDMSTPTVASFPH